MLTPFWFFLKKSPYYQFSYHCVTQFYKKFICFVQFSYLLCQHQLINIVHYFYWYSSQFGIDFMRRWDWKHNLLIWFWFFINLGLSVLVPSPASLSITPLTNGTKQAQKLVMITYDKLLLIPSNKAHNDAWSIIQWYVCIFNYNVASVYFVNQLKAVCHK